MIILISDWSVDELYFCVKKKWTLVVPTKPNTTAEEDFVI